MSNVQQLLNAEIRRLARKEIKVALESLVEANRVLKDRVAELEKMVKSFPVASVSSLNPAGNPEGQQAIPFIPANRSLFQPKNIKKLRKKCNMSQKQFAAVLEVSPLTICFWEKGRVNPGPEAQRKLTELSALSKADLLQLLANRGLDFPGLKLKMTDEEREAAEAVSAEVAEVAAPAESVADAPKG